MKKIRQKHMRITALFLTLLLFLSCLTPIGYAATEKDVTKDVSLVSWNDQAELKYTNLYLGENVLPSFAYGAIDQEAYQYVQDYIVINGKTVREINESTDTSSYTFTIFPSTADAKYRVPVMLLQDGQYLTIKVHSTYLETVQSPITITIKNGLSFENGGQEAVVKSDVVFTLKDGNWEKKGEEIVPVDITKQIKIDGWNVTGDASELMYTIVEFGKDVLPEGLAYGVMDNENYLYIQDYITINGKTVREINANTDVSKYVFSTFPSSVADQYKVPVIVLATENHFDVKVHKDYVETLGNANIVVGIKKGLSITNKSGVSEVAADVEKVLVEKKTIVDITKKIQISEWLTVGDAGELQCTFIKFGKDVLPQDLAYGVMDNANYMYIQDYITINGKTVREINASTDVSKYVFSTFPSSVADQYKVPVIVLASGDQFDVKVHKDYVKALGNVDIIIEVKKGLSIANKKRISEVTANVNQKLVEKKSIVDITKKVNISEWVNTGTAGELQCTFIDFGKNVLSNDIAYGAMDNANYMYIQDYITINGKKVSQINKETNTKKYVFSTFPSTADAKYQVPVMLLVEDGKMTVKIHRTYLESLKEETIEIAVLKGFEVVNGSKTYQVTKKVSTEFNILAGEKTFKETVDVTQKVTISGWITTGDASELTYTWLNFGDGVLPKKMDFGIMDNQDYMYLQDYIMINGKTIREINVKTNTKNYQFKTFPSTMSDYYKVPIIVFSDGKDLQIKIHNQYLASLGGRDVMLTVKAGFMIVGDNQKAYKVTKDLEFTNRRNVWLEDGKEVDIADKVNVFAWTEEGSTYSTYIEVKGLNIFENETTDAYALGMSFLEYITVNGKTAKQINDETNTKGYKWDTFPATEIDSYKVPIVLFVDVTSGTIRVKIHKKYLERCKEISVGINTDFYVKCKTNKGVTYYYLSESVDFLRVKEVWSNRNKEYKVTYYLNDQKYGKDDMFAFNKKITLRGEPDVEEGYSFSGWDYNEEGGILSDVVIRGYVIPIDYSISYVLDGGMNDSTNPIRYRVVDGTIVLKDAVKEGATFTGWYSDEKRTKKVTEIKEGSCGDLKLYAGFEGDGKEVFRWMDAVNGIGFSVILILLACITFILVFFNVKKEEK